MGGERMGQPILQLKRAFSYTNCAKWKAQGESWLHMEQAIYRYVKTYFGTEHPLYVISSLRLADAYEAAGALQKAVTHAHDVFRYYLKYHRNPIFLKLSAIRLIRYYGKMGDGDELCFFYHKLRREGALDRQVLRAIFPYLFHLDPLLYGDAIESFIQEGLEIFSPLERAVLLLNAGVYYYKIQQTEQAIAALQEGIRQFKNHDPDEDYLLAAYVLLKGEMAGHDLSGVSVT